MGYNTVMNASKIEIVDHAMAQVHARQTPADGLGNVAVCATHADPTDSI